MGSPENFYSDEPLTPAGRLFLHPTMNTIIHCAIGVKNIIDVDAIKSSISNSLMMKQPRFQSLLVRDKNGREHWKKTDIDIDRHVIIVEENKDKNVNGDLGGDDEAYNTRVINDYIAEMSVSTPLSEDKPLWEIHILMAQKCAIFRIHHALGDGVSLMSLLLASCRKKDDPEALPTLSGGASGGRRKGGGGWRRWREVLVGILKMVLFSFVFCLEFVLRALWVRDRETVVSGGSGVELWPRKMATARFLIDDMKVVKNAIANATINDVLFGIVSSGLSRYLDHRSPKAMQDGVRLTGVAMVNLRQQPGLQELSELNKRNSRSRWGNKFGVLLLPVHYQKNKLNALDYVKKAKKMIDRKKHTLEAHFSYKIGDLAMSLLGPKVACMLNYRVLCNTTFTISNVIGPNEEINIVGNPVTFIRVNTSSIPHALTMHMASYAGRAEMQLLVAKDIIPDPEFLAKCIEDALLEMKEAAAATK